MENSSQARIKLWRSMRDFAPDPQIESIEFGGASPLSGQFINFSPFTVICGPHGSGKSAILHYISEGLCRNGIDSTTPPFVARHWAGNREPLGGEVELMINFHETEIRVTQDLDISIKDNGHSSKESHVCSSLYSPYDSVLIPEFFDNNKSPSDLQRVTGELGALWQQKRRDLDALREIIGIPYDEMTYTPVVPAKFAPIFPFVNGKANGTPVDCYSMSFGELSVHRLRWEVRSAHETDVVLLDEPEANIAPRGHAALLDELARLARSSNSQVILTTHSPAMINRVPLEFVRVCVRVGNKMSVTTPNRRSDIRDALGVESPLRYFITVEDDVAEEALKLILMSHSFSFLSEMEILRAGSWNSVLVTASGLSSSRRTRTVPVLDGDQRQNKMALKEGALFLPGSESPEKVFLEAAFEQHSRLADGLRCSAASMRIYISELLGKDHHRWLNTLSVKTGNDWRYCLRVAFEIWCTDTANSRHAEELARAIEERLAL